jgi:hypothetical protein
MTPHPGPYASAYDTAIAQAESAFNSAAAAEGAANNPIITLSMLDSACEEQRDLPRELFGEQVEVTEALCVEHASKFHWDRAAKRFLTAPALAEYDLVTVTASAEYERVTEQASAEYEWVTEQASAEYDRATEQALAEYQRGTAPALAEYERVNAQASAEYERVTALAYAEYQRVTAAALAEYQRVQAATFARLFIARGVA